MQNRNSKAENGTSASLEQNGVLAEVRASCYGCGKRFTINKRTRKINDKVYCSKMCSGEGHRLSIGLALHLLKTSHNNPNEMYEEPPF